MPPCAGAPSRWAGPPTAWCGRCSPTNTRPARRRGIELEAFDILGEKIVISARSQSHRSSGLSPLQLGAAYYPEHWPETRWPEDIRLMREAGFTVVRMAEFAWSSLEPAAGDFRLDWLERAIDAVGRRRHPDRARHADGRAARLADAAAPGNLPRGERRAAGAVRRALPRAASTSPQSRRPARRIVTAMAERFGANPHVSAGRSTTSSRTPAICATCRAAVPGLPRGAVRHAGGAQRGVDHRLLEPDLLRLVADPDPVAPPNRPAPTTIPASRWPSGASSPPATAASSGSRSTPCAGTCRPMSGSRTTSWAGTAASTTTRSAKTLTWRHGTGTSAPDTTST